MRRRWILLVGVLPLLLAAGRARQETVGRDVESVEVDADSAPRPMPRLDDAGYFLSRLDERNKSDALNVLADLASESRLPPGDVAAVLGALLDGGSPPEAFGYGCANCFQKRLSTLLAPLRLRGPRVNPPQEGLVLVRLDEGFLKRIQKDASPEFGGTLPGLVQAIQRGWTPVGKFIPSSYVRYHDKSTDPKYEPAFFLSGPALMVEEGGRSEPLDAWELSKWACEAPPRNRFDPGFLLLSFDPSQACTDVRIPTAADTEDPDFRPTPPSEKESGVTCGGAPQWVCPNFPYSSIKKVRFVPNKGYFE